MKVHCDSSNVLMMVMTEVVAAEVVVVDATMVVAVGMVAATLWCRGRTVNVKWHICQTIIPYPSKGAVSHPV